MQKQKTLQVSRKRQKGWRKIKIVRNSLISDDLTLEEGEATGEADPGLEKEIQGQET